MRPFRGQIVHFQLVLPAKRNSSPSPRGYFFCCRLRVARAPLTLFHYPFRRGLKPLFQCQLPVARGAARSASTCFDPPFPRTGAHRRPRSADRRFLLPTVPSTALLRQWLHAARFRLSCVRKIVPPGSR